MGRGTFRRWRRELGRPSPARRPARTCRRSVTSYNRTNREVDLCRVGVGGGRSTDRTGRTTQPPGREGPLLRLCASAQGRAGECPRGNPAKQDKVRELQRTLYRAAKADPKRRFHALYDKVHRRDVLKRAWAQVRANRGAPGIDRITIVEVEEYGVSRLLDELSADLEGERWRPLPARRVWVPKPGASEQRPLSIPAVRDRIVQAAAKIVIEPIFEADFVPDSFGFRPKRSRNGSVTAKSSSSCGRYCASE